MPFNRSPTISSRSMDRQRQQQRPKRSETASPPQRTNTRKVNVVSKASLAMLNPAYAFGIEAGPSWHEEQEAQWRKDNERDAVVSPMLSPSGSQTGESQWSQSPTPELEAFMSQDDYSQESREEGGLGLILEAPGMERKFSSESVFEDDEPIRSKRPVCAPINTASASSSSSSLSRFFTWKRSAKGKQVGSYPTSWDVPHSAPSHVQTFELPHFDPLPSLESSKSMFATSVDMFEASLPRSTSKKSITRKSSMPTLRDIRRATGSPLTPEISFASTMNDAASSFYWRETPKTPIFTSGNILPYSTPLASTPGNKMPTRSINRISSMGRGAARKSTVEVTMMPVVMVKPPKKKQRADFWDTENMPPIPTHPSVASLIAVEKEEEDRERIASANSQSICPPKIAIRHTRQRSRSVGGHPTTFTLDISPPPGSSSNQAEEIDGETHQAVRVNVAGAGRGIVGTASPKLLAKNSPAFSNTLSPQRPSLLLQVVESPVVVNVMPPTPDLGAVEQETFQGASASPSVRRSRSEAEMGTIIESIANQSYQGSQSSRRISEASDEIDQDSDDESFLPYATGERFEEEEDEEPCHRRTESAISDMSDITSSVISDGADDGEEPFGFARSMSTMSLSSEASVDSDLSDEGIVSVASAKILSASSTTSSFSRAHLVSPRLREFSSSWSSQSGFSTSSGDTSMTSLPSCTSLSRRNSKRLSGLPSLSSGQSLASVMTTSSSILDYGAEYIRGSGVKSNLSSPVELQGAMEEGDCDTPRLSGGYNASMASCLNTTKPLVVRKINSQTSHSDQEFQQSIFSPISPRPFPRAHNATSPHLELDLSLPLDLHEIGLGFEIDEVPKKREKPRVPIKSRARAAGSHCSSEPKTPPSTTRLLSSVMKEQCDNETFGLGLGLGLDSALQLTDEEGMRQWQHQQSMASSRVSPIGLAI